MTAVTGGETSPSELGIKRSIIVASIVALLLVAGFVGTVTLGTGHARAAATPRTFTVGLVNINVVTYNPMSITLVDEYIVVYNVYSTLITYDANYHAAPDLAYNWTLSSDQLTWTFHLVHNAYFTDPTNPGDRTHPVTSADVLFSFQLNQAQTGSILHSYTTPIVSMATPDPYTFTISTATPFAAIYSTASAIPILPAYVWSGVMNPVHFANSNPIGSGAMYYDTNNATFGTNIILRRSPNYYGLTMYCQTPRPDIVYYKDYTSSALMVQDFLTGASGLDAIMNVDPAGYLNVLPANGASSHTTKFAVDTGFVGEFSVNVMQPYMRKLAQFKNGYNNPLLLNDTVRLAIAKSIDKAALVKYALLGLGAVGDTLVPDSNPWHYAIPSSDTYTFDPTAARALLNAAGWAWDSAGNAATATTVPLYQKGTSNNTVYWPLSFRFYTLNTAPEWQVAANNITAWLAKTGIQTTDSHGNPGYSLMSVSQLSGKWFTGDYDVWLWDWVFTPASDPSLDVMEVETTMAIGPTSDNFYSNSTFDSIYNQSLSAMNLATRRNLTNTLQKMVYDYHSYILPYYRLDLYAATDGRPTSYSSGWTNYGNWSKSVGLTPDSDLPNLWYNVAPLDNMPPTITSFPSVNSYATINTILSVAASDPESDIANYAWNFGDGSFANTTTPTATHVYATAGNYSVSVRVSDTEWPVCGVTKATIQPYTPGQNTPPQVGSFVATLSNGSYGLANSSTKIGIQVYDPDNDGLYVTWKFGDGATGTSYIAAATSLVWVNTTHTYTTAGTFTVNATVTDNQTAAGHTLYRELSVTIKYLSSVPPPTGGGGGGGVQPNAWINYGIPLLIVAIVVIAVVAVLLRRRKASKDLDKEDETPPQQGPPSPPPPPPPP